MKRRILHVVGRMHRAGIETWLMQIVRRSDYPALQHDFLVHTSQECAYDAELLDRGCRIYRLPGSRKRFSYARSLDTAFQRALADGPVHAVHSHEQLWSGLILRSARQAGIPLRIAHSHNETLGLERFPSLHRALFGLWMRRLISRNMTHGLSCSALAAPSLFGPRWRRDARVALHYYGLDFGRFVHSASPDSVRAALSIPPGRKVVGHVGRCEPQKNQFFLLRVFREACALRSDLHLLFIGQGALESRLREAARAMDLSGRVTFLGNRSDVASLMVSAMDVFLLPSLHEGLPLVLIEAQAAGLPCLFSSEITREADLFPETNTLLSCRHQPSGWALELIRLLRLPRPDRLSRLEALDASPFSASYSLRSLHALYNGDPPPCAASFLQQEAFP